MSIDIHTLTIIAGLLNLALFVVMMPAWAPVRDDHDRTLALWTVGLALQALYWVLLWQARDTPTVYWLVPANMAQMLSFAVFALAVHRFARVDDRRIWVGVIVLLGLAGSLWFGVAEPSYPGRVAVVGSGLALLMALAALPLLAAFGRSGQLAERITAVVFLGGAAVLLLRVLELPLSSEARVGALRERPTQLLTLVYISLMPVFITIGFLQMHARRAHEEVVRLAATDALTGALSRRALVDFGNRALADVRRHRRPLSVMLVDVDRMRLVNDTYGARAGDAVLRGVAQRMRDTLRTEDAIGRLGGKQFVAVLPDADLNQARVVAERLRASVATEHSIHEGEEVPVTVSIGIAGREAGEAELEPLLQRADAAMYAAKRAGRDRVQLAPGQPEHQRHGGQPVAGATMGG